MALYQEFRMQGNYLFKHRGILPLVILVPALIVYIYNDLPETKEEMWYEDAIEYFSVIIGLLGLLIRAHAVGHAAPRTSGRNTDAGQVADSLNTTGMYSMLRHPLYLGNFLMWAAPALWTMELWFFLFFVLAFWLYYERIMYAEEAFLAEQYGDLYSKWASQLPAFIPNLRRYKKAVRKFNCKKVLRQEKSGLLALFLVFWLFDISADLIGEGLQAFDWDFWSIGALLSLFTYIFIKVLQKSGKLQDN
jgi:protein-S-isoprenylcysteine O-methyltransferase Ste14